MRAEIASTMVLSCSYFALLLHRVNEGLSWDFRSQQRMWDYTCCVTKYTFNIHGHVCSWLVLNCKYTQALAFLQPHLWKIFLPPSKPEMTRRIRLWHVLAAFLLDCQQAKITLAWCKRPEVITPHIPDLTDYCCLQEHMCAPFCWGDSQRHICMPSNISIVV